MDDVRTNARRWFQQPLLHFLVLGALLFALFEWTGNSDGGSPTGRIVVDGDILLRYAQSSGRSLEAPDTRAFLDNLTEEERNQLVDEYVRQEVLYREALAMGLQQSDTDIRRLLIDKVIFIQGNLTAPMHEIREQEIRQYYNSHRDDYRQVVQITFAHAFFDNRSGGKETARQRAQAALIELNRNHVPFREGAGYGDAYHYQPNYVQRSQEMIANHFSQRMAAELFAEPIDAAQWTGPMESPYGQHVVLITQRSDSGLLTLEQARTQLTADVRSALARDNRQRAIAQLIDSYELDIRLEPSSIAATAGKPPTTGTTP